ncbi:hypothetical protein ebA4730 [Aromatoleum aromaticum EbN1]|uniref:Uncharacterized protein n=1 Tax=Aromatoleum aromaticum (strain DSM 19018 / LMG 30748 / EbN1) TaxID=76114 RepID=Q5P1L6_AROAE|nr:hypothetical protein ebA4730 [Aromatoleum aromaticum EbN1]
MFRQQEHAVFAYCIAASCNKCAYNLSARGTRVPGAACQ